MRSGARYLLWLVSAIGLPAASTDYALGESLRQLGLRDAPRQAGDGRGAERYASPGGLGLYADFSRDHIIVDGAKVMLQDPLGSLRGHLTLSKRDYDKVFVPLFWARPAMAQRILIDPGHGGKDSGKVSTFLRHTEKAATLDTAIRLRQLLEKQGLTVLLTRTKDDFVELDDRAALAKKLAADLFVSLHFNSGPAGDASADGIETYCLTPAGQRSTNAGRGRASLTTEPGNRFDSSNLLLAWSVQRRMIRATGADDRGVRRARFSVLRTLPCPGVLIEGGFMSNRKEGGLIADGAHRQKLAEAIAAGIMDYVRRASPPTKAR